MSFFSVRGQSNSTRAISEISNLLSFPNLGAFDQTRSRVDFTLYFFAPSVHKTTRRRATESSGPPLRGSIITRFSIDGATGFHIFRRRHCCFHRANPLFPHAKQTLPQFSEVAFESGLMSLKQFRPINQYQISDLIKNLLMLSFCHSVYLTNMEM